jgi:hypothetical protein
VARPAELKLLFLWRTKLEKITDDGSKLAPTIKTLTLHEQHISDRPKSENDTKSACFFYSCNTTRLYVVEKDKQTYIHWPVQ